MELLGCRWAFSPTITAPMTFSNSRIRVEHQSVLLLYLTFHKIVTRLYAGTKIYLFHVFIMKMEWCAQRIGVPIYDTRGSRLYAGR